MIVDDHLVAIGSSSGHSSPALQVIANASKGGVIASRVRRA
jgi:hypothetical protein